MKNRFEPYDYTFNAGKLRRDRMLRRSAYGIRMFVKLAPGLLILAGLVGWLLWALRLVGSPG
jgi:hypothetical protein